MAARKKKPAPAPRRPTKLTQALADALVASRTGSPLFDTQIGLKHGVARSTLEHWLRWGLAEDAAEPYASFARRYSDAGIAVEEYSVEKVREGGEGWKAHAWFLERFRPLRWGQERVPADGPREAIDVQQLLDQRDERTKSLTELLQDPPPELRAALRESRESVLALLDEPALPEGDDQECQ